MQFQKQPEEEPKSIVPYILKMKDNSTRSVLTLIKEMLYTLKGSSLLHFHNCIQGLYKADRNNSTACFSPVLNVSKSKGDEACTLYLEKHSKSCLGKPVMRDVVTSTMW